MAFENITTRELMEALALGYLNLNSVKPELRWYTEDRIRMIEIELKHRGCTKK